ncbi:hypothetical protein OSJ57_17615 [Sphingomonas sp. HH69]
MADNALASNDQWIQIRRDAGSVGFSPSVSIRSSGDIGISADFVRMANIESCTRATIFLSANGRCVGLRFHSDETERDSFQLSPDGGGTRRAMSKNKGRVLQMSALRRQSRLYTAIAQSKHDRIRKYEPKRDVSGMWTINLAPCFENVLRLKGEIGANETGIYRYMLGGEPVYIGRGVLTERMRQLDRTEWQHDRIEYSILNDSAAEAEWEAYWLQEFRAEHGRWPVYNRIGGRVGQQAVEAASG